MRKRFVLLTAALLLVPRPGPAQTPQGAPTEVQVAAALTPGQAQTPQAPQPAGQGFVPASSVAGGFDFGSLFTSVTGDKARFDRYRDSRDGVASALFLNREGMSYLFDATATHVGYRDQRYAAALTTHKVEAQFDWTSIPLNYGYNTRTPYTTNGNALTLPANLRGAVQSKTAVGVLCAPGAAIGATCNATTVGAALATGSIYNSVATPFDLEQLRNNAAFTMKVAPSKFVDIDGRFFSSGRTGTQPFGAGFAFNNAEELPLPIDQRTNDATVGATWGNQRSSLRLAWDGSFFTNHIQSVTWDNPIFLTDFNNGNPLAPYDASGYSNGNGPALGRLATAPSNYMNVVGATGVYKLPRHTTVNGTAQFTDQRQNAALIPWTTNSFITNPNVLAAFPHLASLPRDSAEAEARGINAMVNLSSRLSRMVTVAVKYRYNERNVLTPIFDASEYVRFDAVPEENPEGFSPQLDNSRKIFDSSMSFTPGRFGTVKVGYGHEQIKREDRGFADVGEHQFRVAYDAYNNQYISIRTSYDYGRRRGTGFVEAETGDENPATLTGEGGTQPTLRYYDEADRDRQRGSVVVTVMPHESFDVFVQFMGGKDQYLIDESAPVSRPGELFGLQNSKNTSWNLGLNVHPNAILAMGATYGRDLYESLQQSRNSNPPPDPTWVDPARNWSLDIPEHVNNVTAFVDVLRAIRNTDIRVGYDFSDSDSAYNYGGPRIPALAALGQFLPLPNVANTWHRVNADVQYFFSKKVGVGVGYYFDKLEISDWNTVDSNGPVGLASATGTPRIDYLGTLTTGYGNRPYSGSTGTVRLIYHF